MAGSGEGFDPGGVLSTPGSDVYRRGADRLVGALIASDAAEMVMRDALRAMTEARFLIVSSLRDIDAAAAVLECGIARLQYAMNLTDEEPADG